MHNKRTAAVDCRCHSITECCLRCSCWWCFYGGIGVLILPMFRESIRLKHRLMSDVSISLSNVNYIKRHYDTLQWVWWVFNLRNQKQKN